MFGAVSFASFRGYWWLAGFVFGEDGDSLARYEYLNLQ